MWRTKEYLQTEYIENNRSESNIAKEWGIDPKLLHYYIKKNNLVGIKNRRKYTVNEDKFSMNDPVFCYYAGLIVTDGYIDTKNHRVSLRVKNEGSKEVFDSLIEYFEYSGSQSIYRGCNDLTITSNVLVDKMKLFGVKSARKTYDLKFPKLMSGNEDCQRMFCRGLLDGDGNIHYKISTYTNKPVGGQFRIVTASREFIEGLIRFINKKFEFNYSVSIAKIRGVEYPKLEMKVEDSMKFYDWVYERYEDFRFTDKYTKYQELKMKR